MKVDSALISGVTPNLIIEYINIGKVVEDEPAPDVKNAIINSSKDRVKDNKEPAITPGKIVGRVILTNVIICFPPKSYDASITLWSKYLNLVLTTAQTNAVLKTTWLIIIE